MSRCTSNHGRLVLLCALKTQEDVQGTHTYSRCVKLRFVLNVFSGEKFKSLRFSLLFLWKLVSIQEIPLLNHPWDFSLRKQILETRISWPWKCSGLFHLTFSGVHFQIGWRGLRIAGRKRGEMEMGDGQEWAEWYVWWYMMRSLLIDFLFALQGSCSNRPFSILTGSAGSALFFRNRINLRLKTWNGSKAARTGKIW